MTTDFTRKQELSSCRGSGATVWNRPCRARLPIRGAIGGRGFILTYPEASPVVHPKGIRRKVLRKFPYNLHYTCSIKSDLIVILAVAHQSRRPLYWINRTE